MEYLNWPSVVLILGIIWVTSGKALIVINRNEIRYHKNKAE